MEAAYAPGLNGPGLHAHTLRQPLPPSPALPPRTVWQGSTGGPRIAAPTPWSRFLGRLRRLRSRWRRLHSHRLGVNSQQ